MIVALWEEETAGMVGICVRDRGIGIPASQQAKMFGRFMRADNAVSWGISGTGLGLYLCHELVERHGGQLWFESEEGAGSTFFLRLPTVSDAAPHASIAVAVPAAVPSTCEEFAASGNAYDDDSHKKRCSLHRCRFRMGFWSNRPWPVIRTPLNTWYSGITFHSSA